MQEQNNYVKCTKIQNLPISSPKGWFFCFKYNKFSNKRAQVVTSLSAIRVSSSSRRKMIKPNRFFPPWFRYPWRMQLHIKLLLIDSMMKALPITHKKYSSKKQVIYSPFSVFFLQILTNVFQSKNTVSATLTKLSATEKLQHRHKICWIQSRLNFEIFSRNLTLAKAS